MFRKHAGPRAGVEKFLSGGEEIFVTEPLLRGRMRRGVETVVESLSNKRKLSYNLN
jgi:hypothetical protein